MPTVAPFGAWPSPVTSDWLVDAVVTLGQPLAQGESIVWTEARPSEAGRVVPVLRTPDGRLTDLVPEGWSARTLVHEYGGACTVLGRDGLVFSNFTDQRVWRVGWPDDGEPQPPQPITPEPPEPRSYRYADYCLHPDGALLYAVRERHDGPADNPVVNELVVMPLDGSGPPEVVASGRDFFSAPRPSPDGRTLAWLSWDHPRMPWDGTVLNVAELRDGRPGPVRVVAGGPDESISQPRWSPSGTLHYLSDRSGWWNLYADDGSAQRPVARQNAEMGGPDWVFGQCTYIFLQDGRPLVAWREDGATRLHLLSNDGEQTTFDLPWTTFTGLAPCPDGFLAVAASPSESAVLVRVGVGADIGSGGVAVVPPGRVEVLARSRARSVDPAYVSVPRAVEFPTTGGRRAHALFYAPTNTDFTGPPSELPPLVVISHGGPTAATTSAFDPVIQYFTSRGLAVADVDYGGSTGYGRDYRRQLNGQWGVIDVDDCVNAALWLAAQGEVDRDRLAIRGRSAGGYTTLAALTFRDVFSVGASHYGVADVAALARDTHKFESRYLDTMIGPWPAAEALYTERSPIHHTDRLSCPIILFQGLEDRVVPPDQAEMMAAALRAKGLPFAHLVFEGEQHGFRKADTITAVMEAEVWFYGRVLGFTPADPPPSISIENESALSASAG